MILFISSMGNATTTEPLHGFYPGVAQLFHKKTTVATTTPFPTWVPKTTVPDRQSQEQLLISVIPGAVVGFVLALFVTGVLLRKRLKRKEASLEPPPEPAPTPFNPQELQDSTLYELQYNSRRVFELQNSSRVELPEVHSPVSQKTIG